MINFEAFNHKIKVMKTRLTHDDFLSDKLRRKVNDSQYNFLQHLLLVIDNNYHDPNFTVTDLANFLDINRIYLYSKLKEMLNINASRLLRVYRLHKARELILSKSLNLSVIANSSGFSNASYFTQCFKSYFGTNPSIYQKEHAKKKTFKEKFNDKEIN